MRPLLLKDQDLFRRYIKESDNGLSAASFVSIYIWKDFFDFYWEIIAGNLCLFAENEIGCFLYLPPLGKSVSPDAVHKCFKIMNSKNRDENISRIENVDERCRQFYDNLGFKVVPKEEEYLYLRKSLVALSGKAYKSKRAAVNHFRKNYAYEYLPFLKKDIPDCLTLYRQWQKERLMTNRDRIFRQMLEDNFLAQQRTMVNFVQLGLAGRVVKVDGRICAYTFGFKLSPDTLCLLFEVADLKLKGLAGFIFNEFCRQMKDFEYINCMDASGLENLKRTKLSFRPHRLLPAYIVRMN